MTEPQQSFKEPPEGVDVIGLESEPQKSFKEIPEGAQLIQEPPKSFKEIPEGVKLEDDLSIDEIKQMQSEGVNLSDKLQRKLFDADDERSFMDKASGVAGAVIPTLVNTGVDFISGGLQLANKAVVQPLLLSVGDTRENSEKAQKVFKERDEAIRSAIIGGSRDIEETANAAVRAIYFGTGATDKLLGKSKEERFRKWQDRQVMRDLEAQSAKENPDRTNYLLSQNPLIQAYVGYEAGKLGLPPEEVEKVKQDYIQSMLDSGLTKDQINEEIATFGEFRSPVSIPGVGLAGKFARRITGKALSKVTAPIANKIGNLPARAIGAVAGGTEFAANKVFEGTEFTQTVAKNIGQYAINDPDTWIKGTVNTAILPVVAVAKPVAGVARVVKDIARQVDVGGTAGRRGILERTGDNALSGKGAKGLFGPESKGGVARAKIGDWAIRQSAALVQPGVSAATLNVIMGLPDIETAEDLGSVIGTGLGIGAIGGSRLEERVTGLVDPRTTMAQKITNLVTPDPAAYRRDEDADIKRFMAQASPEIQKNIADLSNIETRKTAIDATIASLERKRDSQINPEDAAFDQAQIDGFQKQKKALFKSTPETQAEATRQTALAFIDAYDLAQSTGGIAGLRGINIAVLDPNNADQFFRNLYGDSLNQAETTVNLLTGIPSLTETDSTKLTEARQLLQRFQTDVEGAKSVRGFAIQEDNTDPNSKNFVPPHLRRINQQGATAVINADLIKHLSIQGFNVRHTLQHEVQHAVQQFSEVQKMLSPLRGQLFDQKIKNDDGTTEVYQKGIYSDEDLDRYATRYANLMSPSDNGASFYAQFGGEVDKMRAYIKDEILSETAAAAGEYSGGTRASLDDVGRNVMDWLEVKTKSGRLKQLKEALRRNGVIFDNIGATSSVLNAQMSPETLAMMRQYQRGLKDFDGTMTIQQSRESDEPDIPLTKVLGSIALQNKYRHADFFEKEQIIKATAPDGSVTEIVVPAGAKIDPFIDVYRTQGGQLIDADGNVVTLGPEITFGSMPDGTKFETDTRIARKSDGSPKILVNREMKARARKRTEIIQIAIDSAKDDGSGVRLSDTGNGNYRGVMSPAQIAAFMELPNEVVSPNLKRMTKFFNTLMAKNDGTRVVMEYQAALLNGKYKALSPKIRDEVPIGFQLSKDGNFLLTTISVSRLYDKMQAWADKKPSNLTLWNGDTDAFWESTMKYLANHAKGEKGEIGLHPDSYIAGRMKNRINDLFNSYNAETKESNPERSTLPRARGKDNLDTVIRGRRLDRINNFSESPSLKIPINYGHLTTNYMPAVNPMAAPMTAEEVQNRFDGSVTATRVRRAMATGEIDALESELRQMDDLLPTESLQLVQGEGEMPKIQIVSMFDPENVASLEPEEIVSDIDAETEAELAILDAQDGTVPPQDIAKVLSSKLDQLYADGGRSPIIPALETELEKINQQLALQAQQEAATMQAEEATQVVEEVAPVTQFMPATIEAPSGERGFQSKLQTEIRRNFKGARATPEQLKAVLGNPQNVKAEEVKWSGVMDEIDRLAQENNGKVPVQELLNYLRDEGRVKFNEVTLGENNNIKNVADQYRIRVEEEYGEAAFYDEFDDPLEFDELPIALQDEMYKSKNQPEPKFAKYQLEGGKNYREVVLSMPSDLSRSQAKINAINKRRKDILDISKEQDLFKRSQTDPEAKALNDSLTAEFVELGKQADQLNADIRDGKTGEQYTSSHFPDVPNYVAHMRLNERTDAEGNEGLFVEEFQSDRHQQGREKGYREELVPEFELLRNGIFEDHFKTKEDAEYELKKREQIFPERKGKYLIQESNVFKTQVGIPDAPFRKDWGVQLFKRALRDAVESGKSWIGWTTGETQAERYDLSKQIGKVVWNEDTKMLTAYDPSQKKTVIQESNITSEKLADYVGKEVAQKLVEQSPDEDMDRQISGLDLKVGGEGMKGFYDQILPKEIGKYVGKMGGKVEKSEIESGESKLPSWDKWHMQTYGQEVDATLDDAIINARYAEWEKLRDTPQTIPIWRVNITPEMANAVSAGQLQFMPAENTASLSDLPAPEAQQSVEKPLSMVRLSDAPEPPKKYAFAYTTSSDRIPLVDALVKAKNWQAIRDLNQATIRHAMSDLPNVKYTLKDLVGAFENEREISVMPEFEITSPEELAEVRKRMVSLGELWQQTEVLEEQVGGGDQNLLGTVDTDGYLHIGKYVLTFDKLTPALVEKARQASGIQAMSYDNNSVIFYDTDNNQTEFERRIIEFGTFITQNGRILERTETDSTKVRSYRNPNSPKEGSLYYNEDPVRLFGEGQLPERLRSPVYRVVSELLGRVLPPPKGGRASYFVKEDVTPKQVKLQNAIANKQAAVVLNDKKNKDVVKAYEELNAELLKQFDALVAGGMTFTAAPDYPTYNSLYPDSATVIRDIRNNNNLVYLKTTPDTFGPVQNGKRMDFSFHPILKDSGRTDASGNKMSYNDILRVVHDAIAHGIYSAQFGPVGEESAWNTHIRTIDNPWARWALTMETRAQNSWVNYQDKFLTEKKTGEDRMPLKKGDEGFIPVPARDYAEQKFALIPLKYTLTGDAKVDKPVKDLMEEIGEKRAEGSPEKEQEWMPSKKEREKIYASIKQPQGTPKELLKQASDVIGKLTRKDDAENIPVIVEKAWVEKKSKDEDAEDGVDDGVEDGEVITTSTAVLKDVVVYSLRGTPIVVRPLPNLFAENVKTKVSKSVLAIAENEKKYLEYTSRLLTAAEKLRQDPEMFTTPSGYLQFMRESGASGNLLMPPSQIAQLVKDPNTILQLWQGGYHGNKTAQGTVAAAIAGLDSVNEMRDLFIQDGINLGPTRMITGLHHMWGILSRQLDPYNQEALWMRMVSYRPVMEQLQLSINGQFALTKGEWQMVVQDARRATKGDYQKAGNNATANANAFHLMLTKHNGKWGELANIYKASDPLVMTNAFWGLGVGTTGIKNKVQRFIGLTFGIHGSVLDRWRFVGLNLPMAMKLTGKATPELYFNYYGRNKTIPEDPVGIYKSYGTVENGNSVFSTALYAGIDRTIQGVIDNSKEMRDFLGVHATPGGFHWVDWNCVKNEAVGHSSLDLTKEFLKRKGRNGTVDDFMDVVQTSTAFTRADQDGRIIDLVMKDGIFQVVEQK